MKQDSQVITPPEKRLRVGLGGRGYDIVVGAGLLANAGPLMRPALPAPRVIVVSDENVAPLYLDRLAASLAGAGVENHAIVLPAGEQTKEFGQLRALTEEILDARVERQTTIVALGGGVIGDLAGFAASITLRGLPLIQVPTSLLAQVDSSVGGKTGINTRHGKNLVGAFHQPSLVLADVETLRTLPRRELLAGYAETVKYGLIDDPGFFDWLEARNARFRDCDVAVQTEAVARCCAAKAAVVAEDEREMGRRALLNLGHTFAHALELQTGYGGALLHGEAVAIGMVMAFDLSTRLGLCPPEDLARVRHHLSEAGLPTDLSGIADSCWSADTLMSHMLSDKKVRGKRPTFVLVRGIGRAFTTQDVESDEVRRLLADFLAL